MFWDTNLALQADPCHNRRLNQIESNIIPFATNCKSPVLIYGYDL